MAKCFGGRKWVWAAVLAGFSWCGAAAAQSSMGQTGNASEGAFELEEVIVTGTRIVRRDFAAPSPVSTLDQEALLSSVQPTLEEALNRMPQITPLLIQSARYILPSRMR